MGAQGRSPLEVFAELQHCFAAGGRLDLGSVVSHTIPLADLNDGIGQLRRADGVRTVVVPGA